MQSATWRVAAGVAGSLVYAGAGAYLGGMNAGWFARGDSNSVLPFLGVGAALVVAAFAASAFNRRVGQVAVVGRAAQVLLVLGPALYVVSFLIEFAIFGTLAVAFGLISLAIAVVAGRIAGLPDRILVVLSAVGSLTWNTETTSAFLLVGVGLAWVVLSVRLLWREVAHPAPLAAAS